MRSVAVSSDPSDRQIYSGPTAEPLPEPPAGREWLEEYRAMAAGFWYPEPYEPESWGIVEDPDAPPPVAVKIKEALTRHLALSNDFLQSLPDPATVRLGDVVRVSMRHERAINLMLRAMLEVFNQNPPTYVDPEANGTQQ